MKTIKLTDNLTIEQRSRAMRAVKAKGSNIERALGKELWKRGLRYRKNCKKIVGKPDIAFISLKIAVFCDSEFWHGYKWSTKKEEIKSNQAFWYPKIEKNMKRDRFVNRRLKKEGWRVLRFWGREINKDIDRCADKIETACAQRRKASRFPV